MPREFISCWKMQWPTWKPNIPIWDFNSAANFFFLILIFSNIANYGDVASLYQNVGKFVYHIVIVMFPFKSILFLIFFKNGIGNSLPDVVNLTLKMFCRVTMISCNSDIEFIHFDFSIKWGYFSPRSCTFCAASFLAL